MEAGAEYAKPDTNTPTLDWGKKNEETDNETDW